MAYVTTKSELLTEGLASYADAKKAIKVFEDFVGEIAKRVMIDNLGEYRMVTEQPDFGENGITTGYFDSYNSYERLEARAGCPSIWFIGWGIQWRRSEEAATLAVYISVRCGAQYKQDKLFRKLAGQEITNGVRLEKISAWPWDVFMSRGLMNEATENEIIEALNLVITTFFESSKKVGGIQTTIKE